MNRRSFFALLLSTASARAQEPTVERAMSLHIEGGRLPSNQRRIRASQGDRLRLRITSDEAGELHLHAFHLSAKLSPGETVEFLVTARGAGRYRLSWHGAGETDTAHDRAPLAVLEVQPR